MCIRDRHSISWEVVSLSLLLWYTWWFIAMVKKLSDVISYCKPCKHESLREMHPEGTISKGSTLTVFRCDTTTPPPCPIILGKETPSAQCSLHSIVWNHLSLLNFRWTALSWNSTTPTFSRRSSRAVGVSVVECQLYHCCHGRLHYKLHHVRTGAESSYFVRELLVINNDGRLSRVDPFHPLASLPFHL